MDYIVVWQEISLNGTVYRSVCYSSRVVADKVAEALRETLSNPDSVSVRNNDGVTQ
jgi:hypothetical protein